MEDVGTAISGYKGTNAITCTVLGTNDFGDATSSEYAKYVFAKDATLTAPADLTVDTVAGYKVVYEGGKYQVTTNFVAAYENMRFGNTLSLLYAIPQYEELVDGCYVEFVHVLFDGTKLAPVKVSIDAWTTTEIDGVNYYVVEYNGLAAKQMTELVNVTFYDAQGNALGETFTSSIQDYATRVLNGENEFHKVVIAMLNYGAAAQTYFEYNTSALANSSLKDAQKKLTPFGGIADPRTVVGNPQDVVLFTASGVRFNDSINLIFQFKGIDEEAAEDLTVTFTANGEVIKITELAWVEEDQAWAVELDALNIADAYDIITCEISRNGKKLTITDSVAGYISRRLATIGTGSSTTTAEKDIAAKNLYTAFMNFAEAAGAKPTKPTN
jgi:hypothetical protein